MSTYLHISISLLSVYPHPSQAISSTSSSISSTITIPSTTELISTQGLMAVSKSPINVIACLSVKYAVSQITPSSTIEIRILSPIRLTLKYFLCIFVSPLHLIHHPDPHPYGGQIEFYFVAVWIISYRFYQKYNVLLQASYELQNID